MTSTGLFRIDEKIVKELYKKYNYKKTKDLLFEMFIYGGRISIHEYQFWEKYLENLAKKKLENQKVFD